MNPLHSSCFRGALFAVLFGFGIVCCAQESNKPTPVFDTETDWQGIHYQIVRVQRIMDNRLMVEIRILANKETAPRGVFLGTLAPPVPKKTTDADHFSGRFNSKPFSLEGAIMTDELSGTRYSPLSAVAPPGKAYYGNTTLKIFRPGDFQEMSIQFHAPPFPPPPPKGQKPTPQTLSFLLPKSKSPILHVPLPPLPPEEKRLLERA
jgi:hypothetical protein